MTDEDTSTEWTYNRPKHGWTCFFCGETYRTPGSAELHFGGSMGETVACRIKAGDEMGLLMELRKAQSELSRYRNEDSDKDREMCRMQSDHATALIREEEKGYSRGLMDGLGTVV